MIESNYYAKAVMMVRPKGFCYNPETATSNFFQQKSEKDISEIQKSAMIEFNVVSELLINAGIEVFIFEEASGIANPDAVFPNNWFSILPDGNTVIYPMANESRRKERHINWLDTLMENNVIQNSAYVDLSHNEEIEKFLEGTGSIVFDHKNRIAFAAISPRTDQQLFDELCKILDYKAFSFETLDENGQAVYHTNVILSISPDLVVFCPEVVIEPIKLKEMINLFTKNNRTMISLNLEQMKNFAANCIALANENNQKHFVISKRAYDSLSIKDQKVLSNHFTLLIADISTIEDIGGGGIRCMLAELFNS